MKDNFPNCLAIVLKHEGGYVNDPHDPGGETNFGISKRAYPTENIKGMTKTRAAEIYRRDYWDAVAGDELPYGLDLVAFDAAVNSGVMRGSQWVQKAVMVEPDGRIGPITVKVARKLTQASLEQSITAAVRLRLNFLASLKTWPRYKNGWTRRCEDVEFAALAMAKRSRFAPVSEPKAPKSGLAAILGLLFAGLAYVLADFAGWISKLFGG